jgi:hypothetical protein
MPEDSTVEDTDELAIELLELLLDSIPLLLPLLDSELPTAWLEEVAAMLELALVASTELDDEMSDEFIDCTVDKTVDD